MRINIIFLVIFAACLTAVTAKESFTVLSRSGDVMFREKTETGWRELIAGENLESRHIIRIGLESKVNLLQDNGKCISLGTPGEYKIEDVLNKANVSKGAFTARFFSSIYNTISRNTDYFRDNKFSGNKSVSGIVLRNYSNYLSARSPVNSCYISDEVNFTWFKSDSLSEYVFSIKDMFEHEIFSIKTYDTTVKLNLAEIGVEREKYYFWQVKNKNGTSDGFYIYRMTDEKSSKIMDTLTIIERELVSSDKSLVYLAKAQFLEENKLIYDSETNYRNLLIQREKNQVYKKLFLLFLVRHNMLKEADLTNE